jgi:hypothetical protein
MSSPLKIRDILPELFIVGDGRSDDARGSIAMTVNHDKYLGCSKTHVIVLQRDVIIGFPK